MSNFLRKLKRRQAAQDADSDDKEDVDVFGESEISSLDVDVYKTEFEFILIAQIPGVSADDLEIELEGDNDIVIINAERSSPIKQVQYCGEEGESKDMESMQQECDWNKAFRRVPLSKVVKPDQIDAKIVKGVLILTLPFSSAKREDGKTIIKAKEEGEEQEEK